MGKKVMNRLLSVAAPLAASLLFVACTPPEAGDPDTPQPADPELTQPDAPDTEQPGDQTTTQINLTAEGRDFFIDGEDEANPDLVVQQGDTVEVTLCVTGGNHDWVVDEFAIATEQIGEDSPCSTVEFVADQVGEFEYYCSVGNHREQGMYGTLVVE